MKDFLYGVCGFSFYTFLIVCLGYTPIVGLLYIHHIITNVLFVTLPIIIISIIISIICIILFIYSYVNDNKILKKEYDSLLLRINKRKEE